MIDSIRFRMVEIELRDLRVDESAFRSYDEEGRKSSGMNMAEINLNLERCKGCGLCVGACPIDNLRIGGALNQQGIEYAEVIDPDRCTGCGLCFRICPDMAIEIQRKPSKAGSEVAG